MAAIVLQIVGAVLLVAGVVMWSLPLGLVVAGLVAGLFGIAVERDGR